MLKYSNDLNLTFKALTNPTRRAIVEHLVVKDASVSELAEPFKISLPALVQHLQVLEKSGLVNSKKRGRVRFYSLSPKKMSEAEEWFLEQKQLWEARLNRLEKFLDEDEKNE